MIGKIQIQSSGYDPDGPPIYDKTLGEPNGEFPAHEGKPITLTPIGARILVIPISETYAASSLHIEAEQMAKELRLCLVLSVGPKAASVLPQLKPGCGVYVKPFFGTELIVNGNLVLLIKAADVQGVANLKNN